MPEFYWKLRSRWAMATETQRDHLRILAGFIVIVLLVGPLYFVSRPFWRHWQRDRALAQAEQFVEKQDYRSALLSLRRATELDLSDIAVWRKVADFLGGLDSPEVLVARRNLVYLAPGDLSLRLAYVMDALRFGELEAAREMAEAVAGETRQDANFLRMAVAVAYATGQRDDLEANLAALVRRDPQDQEAAFNLASFQLWGPSPGPSAEAQVTLRRLVAEPAVRVRAALELLRFVARTGQKPAAVELVAFLVEKFTDRKVPAFVAGALDQEPPGWEALLEVLRQEAAKRPADAAALGRWLATLGLVRDALVWLDGLPAEIRRHVLVRTAELDLVLAADDHQRLRTLLLAEGWLRMPVAAVDLALATRWQVLNRQEGHARLTWEDASISCANSLPALRVLVRLAAAWNFNEGKESVLRDILQRYPTERWAFEALRGSYLQRRAAEPLWQLYKLWLGREPNNRRVVQSWIILSLLLERADATVHAAAREAWRKSPQEVAVIVCYAASLRAQGRKSEALEILDRLPEAVQRHPRVALWHGLLLSERGRKPAARRLLEAIDPRELLEEEARLLRLGLERTQMLDTPSSRPR